MNTQSYRVEGMTCGHCAHAVAREVGGLDGVSDVAVDVAGGIVTVTTTTDPSDDTIAAAVDEAGYTLVGRE